MGYGLIGVKGHLENSGLNAMQQVASGQERDKALEENLEQAEKATKTSAIASGAGMGFAVGGPVGAGIGAAVGWLATEIF